MKSIIISACFVFFSILSYAQVCTPTGIGASGVMPPPDSISCIEKGVFYEQIMQTQNYDSFSAPIPIIGVAVITINSTRIDSLKNFPCGISWETNKVDNTYTSGETGCIRIFGTTTDEVGQYPLEIFMTFDVTIDVAGQAQNQVLSGEINDLIQQLDDLLQQLGTSIPGIGLVIPDLDYFSRVTMPGNACPPIDRSGNNNRVSGAAIKAAFTFTDSQLDVTFNNTSVAADTYLWDFGDGQSSTMENPSNTYAADGIYDVELIVANNCGSDTTTQRVTVITVGIGELHNEGLNMSISPNPNNGNFILRFENLAITPENYVMRIASLSGKIVLEENIKAQSGSFNKGLNLSYLPKGIYTVIMQSANQQLIKKLVIH